MWPLDHHLLAANAASSSSIAFDALKKGQLKIIVGRPAGMRVFSTICCLQRNSLIHASACMFLARSSSILLLPSILAPN